MNLVKSLIVALASLAPRRRFDNIQSCSTLVASGIHTDFPECTTAYNEVIQTSIVDSNFPTTIKGMLGNIL